MEWTLRILVSAAVSAVVWFLLSRADREVSRNRARLRLENARFWSLIWRDIDDTAKSAIREFLQAEHALPPSVSCREAWTMTSRGEIVDLPKEALGGR